MAWPGHSTQIGNVNQMFSYQGGGGMLPIPTYTKPYIVTLPTLGSRGDGAFVPSWTSAVINGKLTSPALGKALTWYFQFYNMAGHTCQMLTQTLWTPSSSMYEYVYQAVMLQGHPFADTLKVWTDLGAFDGSDTTTYMQLDIQLSQYRLGLVPPGASGAGLA